MTTTTTMASPDQNVKSWNRLHAEGYFAKHPRYQNRLHTDGVESIVTLLRPCKDDVLLEIGCGYGRLLWHLLPRVARVVGVDLAPPPLAEARALLQGMGDFQLVQGNGLDLTGIPDRSVTGAYAFTVFQHMTREGVRGYIREAERALVPGGRACFQFFCDGTADREILDESREQSISYSAAQVCDAVEQSGLAVERLKRQCLEAQYPGWGFSWLWVLGRKRG